MTSHRFRFQSAYPDQVNAVSETALKHFDTQIANLIVFVCEGGFREEYAKFDSGIDDALFAKN